MTYGELRLRLTKLAPGVDLELLDGWVQDRYAEILDRLPWQRLRTISILALAAPYQTGTTAVVQGSTGVVLIGGTFTSTMTGRCFRVTGDSTFYEFTYVDPTHGTLDRGYEGASNALATYSVFQHIYPLPADCRIVESLVSPALGPLDRFSRSELDAFAPGRTSSGTPQIWAPYMDDGSTPPRMQVELYPVPDTALGLELTYTAEVSLTNVTSVGLLPWMRPAALIEGVTASIRKHQENYSAADRAEMRFKELVSQMVTNEALREGPGRMQMASRYTQHRARRWSR